MVPVVCSWFHGKVEIFDIYFESVPVFCSFGNGKVEIFDMYFEMVPVVCSWFHGKVKIFDICLQHQLVSSSLRLSYVVSGSLW